MSILHRIDQERGVTYVVWDGIVTADEFLGFVRRLTADPDWPPPRRLQLTDLRSTSLDRSISQSVLQTAADLYSKYPEKIANTRAAVVAYAEFGKAVTFENYLLKYVSSMIVFYDLATACTWLGIDAQETERVLQELHQQAQGTAGQ